MACRRREDGTGEQKEEEGKGPAVRQADVALPYVVWCHNSSFQNDFLEIFRGPRRERHRWLGSPLTTRSWPMACNTCHRYLTASHPPQSTSLAINFGRLLVF